MHLYYTLINPDHFTDQAQSQHQGGIFSQMTTQRMPSASYTSLNQSQELYDGISLQSQINNTIMDQETSAFHSQSEAEEENSRNDPNDEDQKNNDSRDKESLHKQDVFEKIAENKDVRQRKQNSALRGFFKQRPRQGITFVCFGDRRVDLSRDEIQSFLFKKFGQDGRQGVQAYVLLEQVIRKLCIAEMCFQPSFIRVESFSLQAVVSVGDEKKTVLVNDQQWQALFKFQSLSVSRMQRGIEFSKYYQDMQERNKDVEILQILSPDQRDLVEVIERGKTYGQLKEKLLSYYYQMVGRIVLITYHSFKKVQAKTKIGDVQERVLQIYQDKSWEFQDKIFRKRCNTTLSLTHCPHLYAQEDSSPPATEELLVNDSLIWGSLYLQVRKNHLYQRYHGGLMGYMSSDRITSRSLLTLTAAKIVDQRLFLQFHYKHTVDVVTYEFSSMSLLTQLIKAILTVVRIKSHRLQVME